MKLIIINSLSEERLEEIRNVVPGSVVESYKSPKDALDHVSDADAIALWGFQNVQPLLEKAPKVRWVHSLSDGVERLLTPDMRNRPITLTNSHGVHDSIVAEHTMALLLAWTRQLPVAVRNQEQHIWKRPKGISLAGKTIAIVGFGGIGRAIAKRLKAFDVSILAIKKHKSDEPLANEVFTQEEIGKVLPRADVVIAALPTTSDTEKFFGAEEFELMKKEALFINISRASVVDEPALIAALSDGTIAAAALDVFSKEPLPEDHPFWSMGNVIMTPHVASFVPDFWDKLLKLLKENFLAFSKGETLQNVIDKSKGY